ncbi:MAG: 2OG-Fe(II) oxygenase [Pyrinomonadaceae bacterium]
MSETSYLEKLGLFAIEDFLDREFCTRLTNFIENAEQLETPLAEYRNGEKLDESANVRPKAVVDMPREFPDEIRRKLEELAPQIENYFGVKTNSVLNPYAIIYDEGRFTAKHVDAVHSEGVSRSTSDKKITTILFLNDESTETGDGGYVGGKLTFYGLIGNEAFEKFGYPVGGKTGLLLAFPTHFLHEVTPVVSGIRYVISSGYY